MSGNYQVRLLSSAERDLDRFPANVLQQLENAILELGQNPRGIGTKQLKLKGNVNAYRKRSGKYRILYEVDDSSREVVGYEIVDRKDAY